MGLLVTSNTLTPKAKPPKQKDHTSTVCVICIDPLVSPLFLKPRTSLCIVKVLQQQQQQQKSHFGLSTLEADMVLRESMAAEP